MGSSPCIYLYYTLLMLHSLYLLITHMPSYIKAFYCIILHTSIYKQLFIILIVLKNQHGGMCCYHQHQGQASENARGKNTRKSMTYNIKCQPTTNNIVNYHIHEFFHLWKNVKVVFFHLQYSKSKYKVLVDEVFHHPCYFMLLTELPFVKSPSC